MTDAENKLCHGIIHTASLAAGAIGGGNFPVLPRRREAAQVIGVDNFSHKRKQADSRVDLTHRRNFRGMSGNFRQTLLR